MWLINVNTLELEEFIEPDFPYAILSHTWGSEEVSFQELPNRGDENVWRKAGWFTRGWTLQELLAPKAVAFYNASWQLLGSKETLSSFLSSITGIDEVILIGKASLLKVPVATRMSWASKR
ncbi:hypothetical protein CSAL01_08587 [Colletotrichum salicis]|uniref:HET domain-containing protein n=1 Tax=Colletotrichum salicis TaxID=1209931 RepID=A0A135UN41_9PEZI|nr:hypothetical protein CSAL01_08587 [Colletotrichum salicis]